METRGRGGEGDSVNIICNGNQCRDGQGVQRGISQSSQHACGCETDCGEVRCTNRQRPHVGNATNLNHNWNLQGQLEEASRCTSQAPLELAQSHENPHGNLGETSGSLRETTTRLHRSHYQDSERYPWSSTRTSTAECTSSHRPEEKPPSHSRRGRDERIRHRCGGDRPAHTSAGTSWSVPQPHRGSHRSAERRGGNGIGAQRQKATLSRFIVWWQVIIGCGDSVLKKEHRVPDSHDKGIVRQGANAYDCHFRSCAASLPEDYHVHWPHSRTYNHEECIFPFMAIHGAYTMAMQAGIDISQTTLYTSTPKLLISPSDCEQGCAPSRLCTPSPRLVTFSSWMQLDICAEDEIEQVNPINFEVLQLQNWQQKNHGGYDIDRLNELQLKHQEVIKNVPTAACPIETKMEMSFS